MSIKEIYIIGSSGNASVVTELIEQLNDYKIIGFIDDFKEKNQDFLDYKIIGNIDYLIAISKTKKIHVVIAIGDSNSRESIVNKLRDENIIYPIIIHPSAQVSKRAKIGEGSIIFANSIIGCNAILGKHCLVNHASCI
ncbi:hypothetical protein AB6G20_08160 [Providencia hangzhouensis]